MTAGLQAMVYSLAIGTCVFAIGLYLSSIYSDYVVSRGRDTVGAGKRAILPAFPGLAPFARFFGHIIGSGIARLQRRFGERSAARHLVGARVRLQRVLIAAGSPWGLTADEMLGLACLSVIAWTLVGLVIWGMLGWGFPVLVLFLVGLAHPFLWLNKKLSRRRSEIRRLLPYALDLLTLSVEAGLDFTSALGRIVPKLEGTALADEFGELLRAIRLGRTRSDALRGMADRVGMPEVASFAGSLVQADELGADLGPVLRVLADQMRSDRANRAEKKAMEAPVKILFPLIAFIFPTVFIILFASLGISYLSKLFGA